MKWPDRIAQAFRPGVARCRIRPEGAAEMRLFRLYAYRCRRSSNASLYPTDSVAHSGRISVGVFPGLKAWAVLLCHFMAKTLLT